MRPTPPRSDRGCPADRRDPLGLVPRAWGFWSARRYVSLYKPGQAEDVFPYYRPGARWPALRSVRVPVAVIIGGRDVMPRIRDL